MHVFVTGGAGFIGSHLVDAFMNKGHTVTVYDNLSSGQEAFIAEHLESSRFRFVHADLLDFPRLQQTLAGCDLVVHMAANPHVRLGETQTDLDLRQGPIATYNVLEAMRKTGCSDILFSSSSVVYGETAGQMLPETFGPTLPISLYGAGKLGAEGLVSAFCGTFGFRAWVYRFANVVGRRGTHGVIVDFIRKLQKNSCTLEILGDGRQCKPYLYVTDCVSGMLHGYEHAKDPLNLFNISGTTTTTVQRIAELVVEEMGLSGVEFTYTGGERGWKGDVPKFQLDASKLAGLGWKVKWTSDEAVRRAIRDVLGPNI